MSAKPQPGGEAQVADALSTVLIAEAMLMLLAAFGWYEVGKRAQILRPVPWHPGRGWRQDEDRAASRRAA